MVDVIEDVIEDEIEDDGEIEDGASDIIMSIFFVKYPLTGVLILFSNALYIKCPHHFFRF